MSIGAATAHEVLGHATNYANNVIDNEDIDLMEKIFTIKRLERKQEMYIRKRILFLLGILIIVNCRNTNDVLFEKKIMDCLKTGEYTFIIDNSIPDVSERFMKAQLQHYKEFSTDTKFKVLTHEKMYDDKYELHLKSDNGKEIYIQYKKQNNNDILILYLGNLF
jgi:hypothetical protein